MTPSPDALHIQPLAHPRPEVAAAIVALLHAAHEQEAQWLRRPSEPHRLPTVQAVQASKHVHLGALRQGRIEGLLVVAPDDEPGQLCITTLVVQPGAQRRGVGRGLVQDVLKRGPGVVFAVSAATANTAAMALYRQLGFVAYREGELNPGGLPITKLRCLSPLSADARSNASPTTTATATANAHTSTSTSTSVNATAGTTQPAAGAAEQERPA